MEVTLYTSGTRTKKCFSLKEAYEERLKDPTIFKLVVNDPHSLYYFHYIRQVYFDDNSSLWAVIKTEKHILSRVFTVAVENGFMTRDEANIRSQWINPTHHDLISDEGLQKIFDPCSGQGRYSL